MSGSGDKRSEFEDFPDFDDFPEDGRTGMAGGARDRDDPDANAATRLSTPSPEGASPDADATIHTPGPASQGVDPGATVPGSRAGSSAGDEPLPGTLGTWPVLGPGEVGSLEELIIREALAEGFVSETDAQSALSAVHSGRVESAADFLVKQGFVSREQAERLLEKAREDFIPGYRILGKLGAGGMGVVYKAVQKNLNRTVALKVLKRTQGTNEAFLRRFRREAVAGAKLNHPNIVSTYDYGVARGTVYLALEYVDGKSLHERIAADGPIEPMRALEIIRDSVLGLSHAQAAGIIHRDVKPANILLSEKGVVDARGQRKTVAKVADLGIARMAECHDTEISQLTQMGAVIGTPDYMAPEQALGKEIDLRADIYGLGVTLYHMLTGRVPFRGKTPIEVCQKKLSEKAKSPAAYVDGIPEGVVRIVERMMARTPEARYASYSELLADIDAVLAGGEPESAAIPESESSLRRTGRIALSGGGSRARRGRLVAGAVAVVLVACGVWFAVNRFGPTEPTPPEVDPAVLTAVRELASGVSTLPIQELASRREAIAEAAAALPSDDRARELAAFDAAARARIAQDLPAEVTTLEAAWKRRDWESLAAGVERLLAVHGAVGAPVPESLKRLDAIGRAARTSGAGAAEAEAWRLIGEESDPHRRVIALKDYLERFARISPVAGEAEMLLAASEVVARARDAADPAEVERMLADFEVRFPASPDRDLVRRMLAKARGAGRIRETLSRRLTEIAKTDPREMIERAVDLEREVGSLTEGLPKAEHAAALESLARTMGRALDAVGPSLIQSLEKAWRQREWEALATKAEQCVEAFRVARRPIDPVAERLLGFAKLARTNGAGAAERDVMKRATASEDPVERAALLDGFAARFPFSPELDRAERLLAEARAAAPELRIEVIPAAATLWIDGARSKEVPFAGPMRKGRHVIEAAVEGRYVSKAVNHTSAGAVTLSVPAASASLEPRDPYFNQALLIRWRTHLKARGGYFEYLRDKAGWSLAGDGEDDARAVYDLGDWLTSKRWTDAVSGADGWRLTLQHTRKAGASETRVFIGDDHAVVVGADRLGGFAGIRDLERDTLRRVAEFPFAEGEMQRFAIDVTSRGVFVHLGDQESPRKQILHAVVHWQPRDRNVFELHADRRGEAIFGTLQLWPLFAPK